MPKVPFHRAARNKPDGGSVFSAACANPGVPQAVPDHPGLAITMIAQDPAPAWLMATSPDCDANPLRGPAEVVANRLADDAPGCARALRLATPAGAGLCLEFDRCSGRLVVYEVRRIEGS
jgi:hypothetical protein